MRLNGDAVEDFLGTLQQLVEREGLPTKGVAIAVNGDVIPRSQWSSFIVREGSDIEIVTAAAGG